ncbi:MAG: hypothetical protein ACLFUC_01960 [Bacteroidales bacterium]
MKHVPFTHQVKNIKFLQSGWLVCVVFLLSFLLDSSAQTRAEREELFDDAEFFFQTEEYREALYYYKQLHQYKPDNGNINFQIGMCYLSIPGEEVRAIPYFEQAAERISYKYKKSTFEEYRAPLHTLFYLARAYRINNELDKALEALDRFTSSRYFEGNYNIRIVENEIEAAKRAKIIQDKPIELSFTNMGEIINTASDNMNAVISGDGNTLVYITSLTFYDGLFMSKKVDGKWTEPVNITPQVGSDGDCYPTCLSFDGTELYLTRKLKRNSDLYLSRFENDKWTLFQPLGDNINTRKDETHASITKDGKILYFTSNRKGEGGFDIFRSTREQNGEWSKPENLGENINTDLNEATPFISEDGKTLFFSSEGHQNMGGYDIFFSKFENGQWTPPRNIGFPLNTTGDNLFYQPTSKTTGIINLRNREDSLGESDIYLVEITGGDQFQYLKK